jgi:aconitate hydratase
MVLAKSYARIHKANLINFGILPLTLADPADYDLLSQGSTLQVDLTLSASGKKLTAIMEDGRKIMLIHDLTDNEVAIIKAGGLLNYVNDKRK